MEVLAPWHEALAASHLEFHCLYQEKMGSSWKKKKKSRWKLMGRLGEQGLPERMTLENTGPF